MRVALFSKLLATAARVRGLREDEDGNVMIYVTIMATLLLGMVGLALDGSRAMITHSEAQAAADAAALAAASQLDGQAGACARATAEASAVVNKQRFAEETSKTVTMASTQCLNGLPTSDSAATGGYATASDPDSKYVQVTTQQLTHQNTLLAALTTDNTALITRTATAGFRRSLCSASPVMMNCTTFVWTPGVAFDAWINNASSKGFLSDCGPSANCIHDTLAAGQPSFCVVDDSMTPQPGNNTTKVADGINVRFGQGSSAAEPSDTDITDFRPYSNDITGGTGWNCSGYWTAKHPGDGLPQPAGCTSNTTSVTRYSVYQAERAAGKIPSPGPAGKTVPEERRLIYLAIFNCAASGPPAAFLKAFMLTPAVPGASKSIWVEPLGLATSKTDPTAIHEEVQLYR
jgi:Flp pilus assembly protein TadG